MLDKAVDEIVVDELGKVVGVKSGNEVAKCKQVSYHDICFYGILMTKVMMNKCFCRCTVTRVMFQTVSRKVDRLFAVFASWIIQFQTPKMLCRLKLSSPRNK